MPDNLFPQGAISLISLGIAIAYPDLIAFTKGAPLPFHWTNADGDKFHFSTYVEAAEDVATDMAFTDDEARDYITGKRSPENPLPAVDWQAIGPHMPIIVACLLGHKTLFSGQNSVDALAHIRDIDAAWSAIKSAGLLSCHPQSAPMPDPSPAPAQT